MARTARFSCESNLYHITQRGVGRQIIFEENADRQRFVASCVQRFSQNNVHLIAWCLMDNHFHLLLSGEMSDISKAMGAIETSYAVFFNKKHGRTGHLFQNRFHVTCVTNQAQLIATLLYIHCNPEEIATGLSLTYPWSSYLEFIGSPNCIPTINTSSIQNIIPSRETLMALHEERCKTPYPEEAFQSDLLICRARDIVGETDFTKIGTFSKKERNKILVQLKKGGLSIRQIERLTSIGRNVIARAK